jgi:uncharacterized protein YjbJ (UPF0337 family)
MGTLKQKLKGAADQVAGRIKSITGSATGDRKLEARGKGQEAMGTTRKSGAEAVERGKGHIEEAAGNLQRKLGGEAGDSKQQLKGAGRELKGEARKDLNR